MISSILVYAAIYMLLVTGLFLILYAAELRFPRGAQLSKQAISRAFLFLAIYMLATGFAGWLFSQFRMASGFNRVFPLLNLTKILGIFAGGVAAGFMADFFYYWLHRAQHRVPFLWRFHALHHSIEEMGAPTGYLHISDAFFRIVFVALPLSLFMEAQDAWVVTMALVLHGQYVHSATALNFGKFAWVVTDNRVHRIHHSMNPKHHHTNYGEFTLLWDRLFGTAYFPTAEEWPAVGLAGHSEPKTVKEYLLWSPTTSPG